MDKCEYEKIFTNSGIGIGNKTWKPLMRQCMICVGVWYTYFMQGLYLGAPTVLVAQIRREANSTEAVTDETSSWLASMPVISSLPQMFILLWLFHRIGRKFTYLIVCIMSIISFIIFFNSTTLEHILISQMFFGASSAAVNSFTPILLAEYTSPKYRGIFMTIKSVTTFWGIWVSNMIGTFFYWKNIAILSFTCSVYAVTVILWPESPYWLAMKGRYSKCAESHRWLKGTGEKAEKELAQIIQRNSQNKASSDIGDLNPCFSRLSIIWSNVTSPSIYKPVLICIILLAQYDFTGKFVISIYAIDVLKNMTQDESVAYKGMLILDGVTVFSMYLGCILSRYFRRRVLLFTFSSIGTLFLYILSLYLYLVSLSLIKENHIMIIFLLSMFSIAIGCGPMILATSIYGEIIPTRYQAPIMLIVGLCSVSTMSTLLKLSPFMFKTFKMHGCFLFFAISSTCIITILFIHLPETKDKTIKEIEAHFIGKQLSVPQNELLLQKEEPK